MDSQEILNLLKFGEHINLECKKAESKLPNSVWETYSSFANTGWWNYFCSELRNT